MKAQGSTPLSTWKALRRVFGYMRPHRTMYIGGLLLGILDAAAQTSVPLFLQYVINRISQNPTLFIEKQLWPTVFLATALIATFFPVAYFFHTFSTVASARVLRDMRTALYMHIQRLSADFFFRTKIGEIASRINNDLSMGVRQLFIQAMGLVWGASVLVFATIMMLVISPPLFLVFLLFAFTVRTLSVYYLPKIRRRSRIIRDTEGSISATIVEYLGAMDLIRAFSREDMTDAVVENKNSEATSQQENLLWFEHAYTDIMQILARFAAPLTLLFVGAWMVSKERLLIGDLMAFWAYWLLVGSVIQGLTNQMAVIFSGLAAMDRVCEFFDESPLVKDMPGAQAIKTGRGEIIFDDVSFAYPSKPDEDVLSHISFSVPAGSRMALVGPSGAGKSTVLHLLLRFYDPTAGTILIDGQDIAKVNQRSLRANTGIVMQDSVFLSGSIRDNFYLAKSQATDKEIWEALEAADARVFIEAMPDQLNTLVGERGVRLSGGQKQRLSIARVFLKNPKILVFDEPTSALDSVAESQIQQAMDRLLKGRTAVMIAHRIQTIRHADRIIVFEKGHIIDHGVHEDLLERCTLYASLCLHQGVDADKATAADPNLLAPSQLR